MKKEKAVQIPTIKETQCRLLFEELISNQDDKNNNKRAVLGITLNVLTSTFCNKIKYSVSEDIKSKASISAYISTDTHISMHRDLIVDDSPHFSSKINKIDNQTFFIPILIQNKDKVTLEKFPFGKSYKKGDSEFVELEIISNVSLDDMKSKISDKENTMLRIISDIYNQLTSSYSFYTYNAKKVILILDILYYINTGYSMFKEETNIKNTQKIHESVSRILAEPKSLSRIISKNNDNIVDFFLKVYNPLTDVEREVFKSFWDGR